MALLLGAVAGPGAGYRTPNDRPKPSAADRERMTAAALKRQRRHERDSATRRGAK